MQFIDIIAEENTFWLLLGAAQQSSALWCNSELKPLDGTLNLIYFIYLFLTRFLCDFCVSLTPTVSSVKL